MNNSPSKENLQSLWDHCQKFVTDQRISCPETIFQTDRVIENAHEFIEGCCDIAGYYEDDEQ